MGVKFILKFSANFLYPGEIFFFIRKSEPKSAPKSEPKSALENGLFLYSTRIKYDKSKD